MKIFIELFMVFFIRKFIAYLYLKQTFYEALSDV